MPDSEPPLYKPEYYEFQSRAELLTDVLADHLESGEILNLFSMDPKGDPVLYLVPEYDCLELAGVTHVEICAWEGLRGLEAWSVHLVYGVGVSEIERNFRTDQEELNLYRWHVGPIPGRPTETEFSAEHVRFGDAMNPTWPVDAKHDEKDGWLIDTPDVDSALLFRFTEALRNAKVVRSEKVLESSDEA